MKKKILVTGASGFLGSKVVSELVKQGHEVVAFVRPSSDKTWLQQAGVQIAVGDITDFDSLKTAATNTNAIVHAAADTEGTKEAGERVTLGGTRNVLEVCRLLNIEKLVYISSCSVYDMASARSGQHIDENHLLEPRASERGPYTQFKLEAELAVSKASGSSQTSIVILRPGAIYGPGTATFPAMLGFAKRDRFFIVIGMGGMCPPWTYVDNVAESIRLSVEMNAANGQVFNVVDAPPVSKREYIDKLIRKLFPSSRILYVPYPIIVAATAVQEFLFGVMRRKPFLTRYRLVSSQKNVSIDGSRIRDTLNWQPSVSFDQAVKDWKHS